MMEIDYERMSLDELLKALMDNADFAARLDKRGQELDAEGEVFHANRLQLEHAWQQHRERQMKIDAAIRSRARTRMEVS